MKWKSLWLGAIGLAAGATLLTTLPAAHASDKTKSALRGSAKTSSHEVVAELCTAFEDACDVIRPSVVSISAVKTVQPAGIQEEGPFHGTPFEEFFHSSPFGRQFHFHIPHQGLIQQGQGSGFIVDASGYVLTNNHVVGDADTVTVTLADDRTYEATVVGADPKTDLAVLRIDAEDLVAARLGDSDHLRVGQFVLAAGNPFGLSSTMTSGIVSAKGRSSVGIADYENFIQTDASINPGNSGGPLIDLDGRVVGINTAIVSRSGGDMGIGFAIPVNMAKTVVDRLIEHGHVVRGWLGVAIQDLDEGLSESFGYDRDGGVLVGDVLDGPAREAGMKAGDILIELNGSRVQDVEHVRMDIAALTPGDIAHFLVFRNGHEKRVDVKIGEMRDEQQGAQTSHDSDALGLTVQNPTRGLAESLGYEEDLSGAVVTQVDPLGAAALAGIQAGDVIIEVQGESVHDVASYKRELQRHSLKDGVRLLIRRGDARHYVFLKVRD